MSDERDARETSEVGSWAEAARFAAERGADATPAQRFAWLEEMLAIAEGSGALARARRARDVQESALRSMPARPEGPTDR